jgi:hypothetical protein
MMDPQVSFDPSRFIGAHPRPYMPTHFPQFHMYPNIYQNILRPTWKGLDGLHGRCRCGVGSVEEAESIEEQLARQKRATDRAWFLGSVMGVFVGTALGFVLAHSK